MSPSPNLCWTSVKDALPPMDEEVIVLTDDVHGKNVPGANRICFGHIVDKTFAMDYDGWNIPGVHHWMPNPYLPEEQPSEQKPFPGFPKRAFEMALAKAWKEYDEGARNVDRFEDNFTECAHAKGFLKGFLFGIRWKADELRKAVKSLFYESLQKMDESNSLEDRQAYDQWTGYRNCTSDILRKLKIPKIE